MGADVNAQLTSWKFVPLHLAALYNKVEVVKMLLDYGADKDIRDIYNMNAASWAHFHKHYMLRDYILNYKHPSLREIVVNM